jgi:hypothetical protein
MFKFLFKGLASSLALGVLTNYRNLSVKLMKIETAKSYLHGVRGENGPSDSSQSAAGRPYDRPHFSGRIAVSRRIVHPAALDCKSESTARDLAISEKTWMEKSGATRMLKDATDAKN